MNDIKTDTKAVKETCTEKKVKKITVVRSSLKFFLAIYYLLLATPSKGNIISLLSGNSNQLHY